MAEIVYILCAATSIACAVLLLRAYRRTSTRLLSWAGVCFLGLATNNIVLFIDLVLVPDVDLFWWRTIPALAGVLLLLYGLTSGSQ